MKSFMQCCYTRVGGQAIGSGWQSVACSTDVPLDVQKNYGTLQNANVPVNMPVDENGNPLNLFDISVMGDYLYLTRIQYGLLDELNRKNNMYAHTFIFNGKDNEIFENPNIFLTVTDNNFKASVEEALDIPKTLERRDEFHLKEALDLCNLDKEGYRKLLDCVYAQIYANKSRKPLYICGVENGEKMRAVLYCIYRGIPYSMRRMLSCATANMNDSLKKNIIFSDRRGSSDLFFDISTQEENVLSPRILSRFARYEFVDMFPNRWEILDSKEYFETLEAMAVKLGNPQALDPTILKIGYQLIKNRDMEEWIKSFHEDEVHERIYEALNARSEKSLLMDQYIARMLSRVNREGWLLREEEEDALEDKLEVSETEELQQIGEQYSINRLSQMMPNRAAEKLSHMKEAKFQNYSRKLIRFPHGEEIMDLYYSTYYLTENVTWKKLLLLLEESDYISDRRQTQDKVELEAWNLYEDALKQNQEPREAFYNYIEVMEKTNSKKDNYRHYVRSAREAYWESISIDDFDIQKYAEYQFFQIPDYLKCEIVFKLMHLIQRVKQEKYSEELLIETAQLVSINRTFFDDSNKKAVLRQINRAVETNGDKLTQMQKDWYEAVVYLMDVALTERALCLSRDFKNADAGLYLNYDKFQNDLVKSSRNLKNVSSLINRNFIKKAKRWESKNENHTVLLDFWLIMGKYEYDNPFEILDDIEMNLFIDDPEFICHESILLNDAEYQELAEKYIKQGGVKAKQVKEWMSLIKKQKKKKQKSEKKCKDIEKEEDSPRSYFFGKLTQKSGKGESDESDEKKKKKGGFWSKF